MWTTDWINRHAARQPSALAQVDYATGRQFTYREMHDRVSRIAAWLRLDAGIFRGDTVALLSDNSSDFYDLQYACGRIGAILVPLNTRLTAGELEYLLKDVSATLFFVAPKYRSVAEAATRALPIRLCTYSATGELCDFEVAARFPHTITTMEDVSADDPWVIIYTSGTTGKPKGAVLTHENIQASAVNAMFTIGVCPSSVNLSFLPNFHIGGVNVFASAVFHAGGKQITLPAFDAQTVLDVITDTSLGVTHFVGVPTTYQLIVALPGFAAADFSGVRAATIGGSPIPLALLKQCLNGGLPMMQMYGLTEGQMISALDKHEAERKNGSAGKPLPHVNLRIVDAGGNDLAPGNRGEIWLAGPTMIKGYWGRGDKRGSDFEGDWFKTGDIGYVDDEGFLYIVDRIKDMYISGGENVYPAEIEDVLSQLPGVAELAVFGVPDEKWIEVGCACLVLRDGAILNEQDVTHFCDGKLARYKIPKHVRFFEAFPHNATGKILKNELRALVGLG